MNQNNSTKAVEVYINFWTNIFDIMSHNTTINNGAIADINANAIKEFFQSTNEFISQLNSINMQPVAMATIMETLYGLLNDIPYVSTFTQANSLDIRSKFGDYIHNKMSYAQFEHAVNDMISKCNEIASKSSHTEMESNYMKGYMEIKGVFMGIFQYFISKEEFLFVRHGDGKLDKMKEALAKGETPKVSMFGMEVYPFYDHKIVELMMEVESKKLGKESGKFSECFGLLTEFKSAFFKAFREGMSVYNKIGFGTSIGLSQDVESCRSKIAIVSNESSAQIDLYTNLFALKNKLMNMRICELLQLSVSKSDITNIEKQINDIKL